MRKVVSSLVIGLIAATVSVGAMAQQAQRSSNPNGVQIQGNTEINANAKDVNTIAVGKNNTAKTSVGQIKGGTQIQGNTKINANAKNVNTVAVGKGNKATTDVGAIGGN